MDQEEEVAKVAEFLELIWLVRGNKEAGDVLFDHWRKNHQELGIFPPLDEKDAPIRKDEG